MDRMTGVELPEHLIDFANPEHRHGFRLWVEAVADAAGEPVPWASRNAPIGKAHDPCPCPAPALHVVSDHTSEEEPMPGHELIDTRTTDTCETCWRCASYLFKQVDDQRRCAICGSPPKARKRARSRKTKAAA